MDAPPETTALYRPVGPEELELIRACGFRRFPPRLPGQPIFYPVCNEEYAREIAEDWNVPHSGRGWVLRFFVRADFVTRYAVHVVGAKRHAELWVPAEDLEAFNDAIVGPIEIIAEYPST